MADAHCLQLGFGGPATISADVGTILPGSQRDCVRLVFFLDRLLIMGSMLTTGSSTPDIS